MESLKLLIAVDESPAAQTALQFIAPLARTGTVEVILLARAGSGDRATAALDAGVTLLGEGALVQRMIRPGPQERALAAAAREQAADLVVITLPPRTGVRRWLRGRQALSLARHMPTSLLLVRRRHRVAPLHRALLAGGGGPSVLDDAALAGRVLGPVGGTVTVCHVLSQVPVVSGPRVGDEERMRRMLDSPMPEVANLHAAVQRLEAAGVPAQAKLRVGLVLDEVMQEVRDERYDLLVIGAHQMGSRLDRLLLADISAELLIHSPVPVLLVRPRTQAAFVPRAPRFET